MKLYQQIAMLLSAIANCQKDGNGEWEDKHSDKVARLMDDCLPSGGGWDLGTSIDMDLSNPERLVLYGSWHHMDPNGYYDGWTDHSVIVTPSLANGFDLTITGKNRDDIHDLLADIFHCALSQEVAQGS